MEEAAQGRAESSQRVDGQLSCSMDRITLNCAKGESEGRCDGCAMRVRINYSVWAIRRQAVVLSGFGDDAKLH